MPAIVEICDALTPSTVTPALIFPVSLPIASHYDVLRIKVRSNDRNVAPAFHFFLPFIQTNRRTTQTP